MAARIPDGRRLSCGSLFVSRDYTTLESQLTERIEMAEAEIKKLEDERATMKAELEVGVGRRGLG